MRQRIIIIWLPCLLFAILASKASAQDPNTTPPKGEFHMWDDAFAGKDGVVIYPQYGWAGRTHFGTFTGYGFLETAPQEPLFTNHLVVFTPRQERGIIAVHTETGGLPQDGKAFFQIGPRLNVSEALPVSKKVAAYLFVTALPKLAGIRTNNVLVSGATKRFAIGPSVEWSVEAYRRMFKGPDYSEYWFLVHPAAIKPFSLGVFVLQDGRRVSVSFGGRFFGF